MKTPTDVLREEHAVILRALDVLEWAAIALERGQAMPAGWWDDLVGWLRAFADRTHHAKEEDVLFPAMVGAGIPSEHGPIAVMQGEHDHGRALVRAIESSEGAPRAANARAFLTLLRAHIDKENVILFPMADAVLDEDAQRRLAHEFEARTAGMGTEMANAEAAVERLATALAGVPTAPAAR